MSHEAGIAVRDSSHPTLDNPTTKLVAAMLATRVNPGTNRVWAGLATLCADTSLSRRAVQTARKALEAAGILTSEIAEDRARHKPAVYTFEIDELRRFPRRKQARPETKADPSPGAGDAPPMAGGAPGEGEAGSPGDTPPMAGDAPPMAGGATGYGTTCTRPGAGGAPKRFFKEPEKTSKGSDPCGSPQGSSSWPPCDDEPSGADGFRFPQGLRSGGAFRKAWRLYPHSDRIGADVRAGDDAFVSALRAGVPVPELIAAVERVAREFPPGCGYEPATTFADFVMSLAGLKVAMRDEAPLDDDEACPF